MAQALQVARQKDIYLIDLFNRKKKEAALLAPFPK
jgi:hypothetical protein